MSRTRAFFVEEAAECLRSARSELERETPDPVVLHQAIRRLRGSAQLARFRGIAARAAGLEERLRVGGGNWPELRDHAAEAMAWLEDALEGVRRGEIEPENEGNGPMDGEARAGGVVGMEELEYRGRAALERASELREAIEDAIVADVPIGPLLDELFDLIRLGMK